MYSSKQESFIRTSINLTKPLMDFAFHQACVHHAGNVSAYIRQVLLPHWRKFKNNNNRTPSNRRNASR